MKSVPPEPGRRRPRIGVPNQRVWIHRWLRGPDLDRRRNIWSRLTPVQLFAGSFLMLILAGTLGFRVLPGLYTAGPLSWLDALFTATSAVCVTGLIVVDTATAFTRFGQFYIMVLIQLGGLGMLTFASFIILGLGRRMSLRHEEITASVSGVAPHIDTRRLIRSVIRLTILFEATAALILWLDWGPKLGWTTAAWHAVFHSISAFCNAGFSTFSDSLMSFQRDPVALTVVMLLIIAGGLGFLTLHEIERVLTRQRKSSRRFSLHSRLALTVTVILLLAGFGLLTLFEWNRTLAGLPAWARFLNGMFMSVTARTAGFNTVDYGTVTEASAFLTIILMAIGGSPGSTAGGIKTTSVALIAMLAVARLRGRSQVSLWDRTVPDETLQRSVGLLVVGFAIVTGAIFVFTITALPELGATAAISDFLARAFEVTSAFGTVGLSTGLTADLSTAARWITIGLMIIGRIGPLAMTAAIALPIRHEVRFRYAHEDVIIG